MGWYGKISGAAIGCQECDRMSLIGFFYKLNRAFEKFFRSISAYDEELFGGSIVLFWL
jgi:hypothetical protein